MKRQNHTLWIGGAVGALVAGTAVTLLIVGGTPEQPAPRAREYTAKQACLLTDAKGVNSAPAASVWAGMEDASLATHAKVMYLPSTGPDTVGNTIPYANTLLQRHCNVILAVGQVQTAAVSQIARSKPSAQFVIVGPGNGVTKENVTTLPTSPGMRSQIARTTAKFLGG